MCEVSERWYLIGKWQFVVTFGQRWQGLRLRSFPELGWKRLLITGIALLATLVVIAVVDIRARRIPDILSIPLICAGLLQAGLAVQQGAPAVLLTDSIIGATAGYLVFAAIGAAFFRMRRKEGLGLGDAKLLAAAGAWLGWQMLPSVVVIAALGGLAQVTVAGRFRSSHTADRSLAFGPWLALAFFSLWAVSGR